MGDTSLGVVISSDVTSLKVQCAIAQAQLRQTSKEMTSLAAAAAQIGPPTADAAKNLNLVATAAITQQANVKRLTAEIKNMGSETDGVFAKNRAAFMELEHSGRAMADGLAAGASPIRLLAMEGARLGQAYANMDAAGKAAVASTGAYGVAAIAAAAAVGTLVMKLVEMHNGLASIQSTYAELGNGANFSLEGQRKGIQDLSNQFHLWQGDAIAVKAAIAGIPNITNEMRDSLEKLTAAKFKLGDMTAEETAKKMVEMFSGSSKGAVDYAIKLGLITGPQTLLARGAAQGGDDIKAFGMVIDGMNSRTLPQFEDHISKVKQLWTAMMENAGQNVDGVSGALPQTPLPVNTAPDPNIGKQAEDPAAHEQAEIADKLNQTLVERVALQGQVAQMQTLLTAANQSGTASEQAYAQSALSAAQIKLNSLHTPEEIQAHEATLERIRSEVAAAKEGSETRIAAARQLYEEMKRYSGGDETAQVIRSHAQIAVAEQEAAKVSLKTVVEGFRDQEAAARDNLARRVEIQKELIAKLKSAGDLGTEQIGQEKVKLTELEQQAADKSTQIRINQLSDQEKLAKNDFDRQRDLVNQQLEVLRAAGKVELDEYRATKAKLAEIDRAELQQKNELATEWASNQAQTAKTELQAEKDRLDAEVLAGKLSNQQKFDALKKFADDSYQIDLKSVEDEYALQDRSAVDQLKTYDKLYQMKVKHNADMMKLSDELATADKKDAEKTQQDWDKVNKEIASSASSSIMSMLKGQATFATAATQFGEQQLQKAISWGIQKALSWAETETGMTTSTVANTAVRNAAADNSNSGLMSMITNQLASWLGLETSKTATTLSETAVSGEAQVTSAAGVAAANAFASTAAIPYVGPELAPAAASAAMGEVMAFGSVASAAGGMDSVPYDNMPARLHEQESVLSAPYARGLGKVIGSFGVSTGAGSYGMAKQPDSAESARRMVDNSNSGGDLHFHHSPTINGGGQSMEQMLQSSGGELKKWIKNQHRNGAFGK